MVVLDFLPFVEVIDLFVFFFGNKCNKTSLKYN